MACGGAARIVAMNANAMRDDADAARASGRDDYIVKPIFIDALRSVLEAGGETRRMREPGAAQ